MAGYSGKALAAKLGIKEGSSVALVGGPPGFDLGPLPGGVALGRRLPAKADIIVFFTTERAELEARADALGQAVFPSGAVWVAWPKRAAKVVTDMTEHVVREVALPRGLVDIKVCAIDDTWSGLKLVWRKDRR